jgi:hypothetical protein
LFWRRSHRLHWVDRPDRRGILRWARRALKQILGRRNARQERIRGCKAVRFLGKNSEKSCCQTRGFPLIIGGNAPVLVRG